MVRNITIDSMTQVARLNAVASSLKDDVGIHDEAGRIADAKSILGILALDFTKPVSIVSENPRVLDKICNAIS